MNSLKISIITVCFNSESSINDTISSVLNQNYENYEYIIIDGKSSDNTINIIKSYEKSFSDKDINYYWISENDKGIYDAFNKGIKLASGDLIGILNSDDWYSNNIFSEIQNQYVKNTSADIFHGNLDIYTSEMEFHEVSKPMLDYKKLWRGMTLKHPTMFVKKKVYDSIGEFDNNYEISADYDFVLRAYLNECNFSYINKSITNMRMGGVSYLRRFESWDEVEIISRVYGLGIIKSRYFKIVKYFKYYVFNFAKKHLLSKKIKNLFDF